MLCPRNKWWTSFLAGDEMPDWFHNHVSSCLKCQKRAGAFASIESQLKKSATPRHEQLFWWEMERSIMEKLPQSTRGWQILRRLVPSVGFLPRVAWASALALMLSLGSYWGYQQLHLPDQAEMAETFPGESSGLAETLFGLDDIPQLFEGSADELPLAFEPEWDTTEVEQYVQNEYSLEEAVEYMDTDELQQFAMLLTGREQ